MLNIFSIVAGLVALTIGLIGFIPLLGWLNWLAIPVALVGAGLGALSSSNSGRNFNLVLAIVFVIRLSLGGGLI